MQKTTKIRRQPQVQSYQERLRLAETRYQFFGDDALKQLQEELKMLKTQIAEKGLDRSNGQAADLVNALRA